MIESTCELCLGYGKTYRDINGKEVDIFSDADMPKYTLPDGEIVDDLRSKDYCSVCGGRGKILT